MTDSTTMEHKISIAPHAVLVIWAHRLTARRQDAKCYSRSTFNDINNLKFIQQSPTERMKLIYLYI